jgi:Nif-specific regulatory protein
MAFLVVREPGRVTCTIPVDGTLRIGRDPEAELTLNDRQVSRHHAIVACEAGGWTVSDLGSRHGMRVNGVACAKHRLADGDRVQIGGSLLVFRDTDAPPEVLDTRTTELAAAVGGTSPEARRLRLFQEIGRAVAVTEEPEALLERMLAAIGEALDAELAVAGLFTAGGARPRKLVWRRPGAAAADEPVVDRALADKLATGNEALLLRGAIAAPLRARARTFGFVHVPAPAGRSFAGDDLDLVVALAGIAATAVDGAERVRRADGIEEARRGERRELELVGDSEPMRRLRLDLARFARADSAIHLRGETGTGKELAARALHAGSPRADEPFEVVNCAAIAETMIESELFGHVRGAFTGAIRDRRGRFVMAHRGSLFLDEVAELSLAAQAKLLRVLEDGEVQPLGAERATRVDVRIISATHKNLAAEVAAGRFRDDLYWRLAVVELELPPLRARGRDVQLLAERFLARAARRMGRPLTGFTPAALAVLAGYAWPGNVRELANEIERAAIVADGPLVDAGDLRPRAAPAGAVSTATTAVSPASDEQPRPLAERFAGLDQLERQLVQESLRAAGGNVSEAARLLGISRIMMRRRLERFDLVPEGDS